ncbi:MAG: RelA/SpoT family protein [Ostreibacterium sp.]
MRLRDYSQSKYYDVNLYGLSAIQASISSLTKQADYLSDNEKQQLINCCFFAAYVHKSQKRCSGEPYICHPIKVSEILAKEVRFDLAVLQAAVLHDVIEDTAVSKNEVVGLFSQEVADLVDGVSKLEKDESVSPEELQARTFEKLVYAMEADPRVVMIKFADRLHNMQTLGALRADKRRRVAQETLKVYVPIASRLGMFNFKTELEELAFQHVYPWRYQTIKKLLNDNESRTNTANAIHKTLSERLDSENINASVRKRHRNLYNIYKKLAKRRFNRRPLENASIPFIIMTDNVEDCYRVLGLIHQLYAPIFRKLTDYIASPRVNGYQSIHTSVLTKERRVINFQIRTSVMHTIAESGIIAIWRYHNESKKMFGIKGLPDDKYMRRWLENIKILSSMTTNPIEFYEAVKRDLTGLEIQVLTPKGEPIALPEGATIIDFAYYIHTDIGNHLESAKVNDVKVAIDYVLSGGQTVELFANPMVTPSSVWLTHIKTARARTAIRHYLHSLPANELEEIGFQELKRYLMHRGVNYLHLDKMLASIAENQYQATVAQLLQKIALYEVTCRHILNQLQKMAYQDGILATIYANVFNQPGTLAKVADIIGHHRANILRIHFPDDTQVEEVTMIFEIHIELSLQLEKLIKDLKKDKLIKQIKYEEILR